MNFRFKIFCKFSSFLNCSRVSNENSSKKLQIQNYYGDLRKGNKQKWKTENFLKDFTITTNKCTTETLLIKRPRFECII